MRKNAQRSVLFVCATGHPMLRLANLIESDKTARLEPTKSCPINVATIDP